MSTSIDTLLDGVRRAYEGDADAALEVFAPGAVLADQDEVAEGSGEIVEHFLAFGGLREVFEVVNVADVDEGRYEVDWILRFRADSYAYTRNGTALVDVTDGRISRWEATWNEADDGDLSTRADD